MWTPISDGHLTPLEGCTTAQCQVALGVQYPSPCPIIQHYRKCVLSVADKAVHAHVGLCCASSSPLSTGGSRLAVRSHENDWLWWEMIQRMREKEKTAGTNSRITCLADRERCWQCHGLIRHLVGPGINSITGGGRQWGSKTKFAWLACWFHRDHCTLTELHVRGWLINWFGQLMLEDESF